MLGTGEGEAVLNIMTNNSIISRKGSALVLAMDLVLSLLASAAAVLVVRWLMHPIFGFTVYMLVWLGASLLCSLAGFLVVGTHKMVIRFSSYRSISRLVMAVGIKEVIFAACLWLQIFHFVDRHTEIMVLIADSLMTLVALILARVFVIALTDRMSEDMEVEVRRTPVLVFGISAKSAALAARLSNSPHYKVEGFLTREKSRAGLVISDRKVWSVTSDGELARLKVSLGIQGVMFAREEDAEAEQDGMVGMCLRCGLHMLMTPKVEESDFGGMSSEAIREVNDSDFIPDGMTSFERNLKRFIDCCLSAVLIVIFALPMLACWIAIKLDDGGPAIYRQERIGRFGRPFHILKFRSMRLDAETDGPALYAGDDDPRLTRVGRFLRVHHLDEMPQLFNVFAGDMAFVGYRPERRYYIDKIMEQDPRYYYLYQIRPGVTSYATLRNGYTDTMAKMLRRLEFDLYYLRHRSIWFDIKVLWNTFVNIAFGKRF